MQRNQGIIENCAVLSGFSHIRLFATPWTVGTPGSSVHGILQARVLDWVAMCFSKRPS